MGLPTVFVRFSGCNLRCSWCDTQYAYEEGTDMSVEDVVREITDLKIARICLTGGEPMLQEGVLELIRALEDFHVSIETNGSISVEPLLEFPYLVISMDIKCPSSGMVHSNILGNVSHLRPVDQLKFVIDDEDDYAYAKDIIEKYTPLCPVIFTPVGGTVGLDDRKEAKASLGAEVRALQRLAELVLQDRLDNVRVLPQLHKLIWPDEEKGR